MDKEKFESDLAANKPVSTRSFCRMLESRLSRRAIALVFTPMLVGGTLDLPIVQMWRGSSGPQA
jgi:hypothetical protein